MRSKRKRSGHSCSGAASTHHLVITTFLTRAPLAAAMVAFRGTFVRSSSEFPTRMPAGGRSPLPGKTLGHGASAAQVLCGDDNLFPSCLTPEKSEEYANALATFLGSLGCNDCAIAQSLLRRWNMDIWNPWPISPEDQQLLALAQRVTALEKDCRGWSALPAALKDTLHKLAAGKTTVP